MAKNITSKKASVFSYFLAVFRSVLFDYFLMLRVLLACALGLLWARLAPTLCGL